MMSENNYLVDNNPPITLSNSIAPSELTSPPNSSEFSQLAPHHQNNHSSQHNSLSGGGGGGRSSGTGVIPTSTAPLSAAAAIAAGTSAPGVSAPPAGANNSQVGGPSSGAQVSPAQEYILKLTNLPNDLSRRELSTIFSLVIDDINKIELSSINNTLTILAYFKNFNTCLTTSKLLNNKFIFGHEHPPIFTEIDENLMTNFNNLSINRPHSQSGQSSQTSSQPNSAQPQSQTQRSRFLFNDPFSQDFNLDNSIYPWNNSNSSSQPQTPSTNLNFDWNQNQAQSQQSQNSSNSALASKNSNNRRTSSAFFNQTSNILPPQSLLNGHNFLLNPLQTNPPGPGQAPGTSGQAPQPPSAGGLGVQQPNAASGPQNSSLSNPSLAVPSNSLPVGSLVAVPSQQSVVQPMVQSSVPGTVQQLPVNQPSQPAQPAQPGQPSTNSSTTTSPIEGNQSGLQQQQQKPSLPQARPLTQPPGQEQQPQQTSQQQGARKDMPDLSLLARVPPPANPADQNPPCNTLYVGNLPPDATEQELRSLFSPQKGFRRLSFRTKTTSSASSSSNHGPMCFVEFEDVAHATRALAELYGRILPRSSNTNGKGGIRLSFSKNPLGVRGPGNQRRSSSNQVNGNNNNNYNNYNYNVK